MNGVSPVVEVQTLGPFRVLKDGQPLSFPAKAQRKPLALLKVLIALGGQEVAEQALTDALWPESEGDAAHANFASTLHRLRELIGQDCLALRDRRLSLVQERCRADALQLAGTVTRGEEALRRGDSEAVWREGEAALALYRGPFLEGEFDPPEILSARSRLHALFIRHLSECARHLTARGQGERAVQLYRRGLEVDGTAEELCQGLMRELQRQGRNAEALAVYARFREALQGLAGAEPSEETRALAETVKGSGARTAEPEAPATPVDGAGSRATGTEAGLAGAAAVPASHSRRRIRLAAASAALVVAVSVAAILGTRWLRSERESAKNAEAGEPPSIAVLPFTNMSGDPGQEYFSDGLTDSLITDLSKLRNLLVIARQSAFAYKGKPVDVRQVGRELNVRYVLEGSVQKTADRVRINAQLVEAETGKHLWAERWDRPLSSLFDIQDEIIGRIVSELEVNLAGLERLRQIRQSTRNLAAFDNWARGHVFHLRLNRADVQTAKRFFEAALVADPSFNPAKISLGWTHVADGENQWSQSPKDSYDTALRIAEEVIASDPEFGSAYSLAGTVWIDHHGDLQRGIPMMERAVQLAPNNSSSLVLLGYNLAYVGRAREGLEFIKKGMRLAPLRSDWMFAGLSNAYLMLGDFESAEDAGRTCVENLPNYTFCHVQFLLASMELGKKDQASRSAQAILTRVPDYSAEFVAREYQDPKTNKRFRAYFEELGLLRAEALSAEPPSIAVLPFTNMSGDPGQEFFADGISETLITVLSKLRNLIVIARHSTFSYKGKAVDVRQVGKELGVRYVLEGSFQRSKDRIRVSAQLIDASNGKHLWAENYDRPLDDIFSIQDGITKQIVSQLDVQLVSGEDANVFQSSTKNAKAYELFLRANDFYFRRTKEYLAKAREVIEQAIRIDPDYAAAFDLLGAIQMDEGFERWAASPDKSFASAKQNFEKAIRLEPTLYQAYADLGWYYLVVEFDHQKATTLTEKAVELAPNSFGAHENLGGTYIWTGKPVEGLEEMKKALRLCPIPPPVLHKDMGWAYFVNRRHAEALEYGQKARALGSQDKAGWRLLIMTLVEMGRLDEARPIVQDLLREMPYFTVTWYRENILPVVSDLPLRQRMIEDMRKAGIPEK